MTENAADSVEEVTLRDVVVFIWREKIIILLVAILLAGAAVAVALTLPDRYTAYALLSPNASSGSPDLSSVGGQLGGLAGIIGLGGGEDSESVTAIETLKSREFVRVLVDKYELAPVIMAGKSYSVATGELELDPELYDSQAGKWVREVRRPFTEVPNAWEIHKKFSKSLSVSEDSQTGLVTLSFEHVSPVVASQVVELLLHDINDHLRTKAISDARQRINYLQEQLDKTSLTQMQRVFYTLIEEQTKLLMLADTRKDYAFEVIDPSVVPMESSSPNRPLIVVFGLFLGVLMGLVIAYLKGAVRSGRTNST